eukprot:GHVR01043680.1.p3 GENE.GHVR01043680.1~~GHVR01043680.1.p3  ORF type:complete len:146 (-),score=43.07 GHVR01043680.1:707-1144(-)
MPQANVPQSALAGAGVGPPTDPVSTDTPVAVVKQGVTTQAEQENSESESTAGLQRIAVDPIVQAAQEAAVIKIRDENVAAAFAVIDAQHKAAMQAKTAELPSESTSVIAQSSTTTEPVVVATRQEEDCGADPPGSKCSTKDRKCD